MSNKYRPPSGCNATEPDTHVGAVIVFKKGADVEKCQRFLDSLKERGVIEYESTAHEYDANSGGPAWYLP